MQKYRFLLRKQSSFIWESLFHSYTCGFFPVQKCLSMKIHLSVFYYFSKMPNNSFDFNVCFLEWLSFQVQTSWKSSCKSWKNSTCIFWKNIHKPHLRWAAATQSNPAKYQSNQTDKCTISNEKLCKIDYALSLLLYWRTCYRIVCLYHGRYL